LNLRNEFSRKEDSSFPIGWILRFFRSLRQSRYVRCVGWKTRFRLIQLAFDFLRLASYGTLAKVEP